MPAVWTDSTGNAAAPFLPDDSRVINGRRHVTYKVTGTGVAAADELDLNVPKWCTQTELKVKKTAGTATTVTPVEGTAANFTAGDADDVTPAGISAAAHIRSTTAVPLYGGVLAIKPVVDGLSADNTVVIQVTVVEGHGAVA